MLETVTSEATIGISASYREDSRLSATAFSSLSAALVVHFTVSNDFPQGGKHGTQARAAQARNLLEEQILCNADYEKYAFRMDRIAIALYLDVGLRIERAVDMLSVSRNDRQSAQALMDAMGGELTLHNSNVKTLFFSDKPHPVSDSDLVQQAWAACRASVFPHMAVRFHALGRISTNLMPDAHIKALAKVSRDGELLDSLKPHTVKNDVMPDITVKMDNLSFTCSHYPTRIRTSKRQFLQIETQKGVQVPGRAIHVEGRKAQIKILGSLHGDEIKGLSRKRYPGHLEGESSLLSHPFFKAIWLPNDPILWPKSDRPIPKIPICCPGFIVNTSQERAIEKILSASDEDRVVLIQGPPGTGKTPPGTGKTTVITAAVTSIVSCPAASSRTIWIAAQSNVTVKNVAEKFDKIGFHDFKLLVSMEFHFDWYASTCLKDAALIRLNRHEHLYERLAPCVIRSDSFCKNVVGASRQLSGARVILCTLSMLSSVHLVFYVQVNPVDILIFDEGSQIEVGNYIPVLHHFGRTLSKIAFIGGHRQLPPYGQEEISKLLRSFEVKHLRKKVLSLDTQYRMPGVIGDFISQKVYNGKLKTCHAHSASLPWRFIDVERGQEKQSGKSWINPSEAPIVAQIAGVYQGKGLDFRIITPYDAQRSLIEQELKAVNVCHEDKVFNVDSFQGFLIRVESTL
ncbi:P-loop containing nucleoside triphosphate hydrolase protein [Pisolithus marmoratus]|nr:P-loop containing nucleoside triphosphate hydrolase protein [Pisolithus marmoratus]